jgi:hypothetical protein
VGADNDTVRTARDTVAFAEKHWIDSLMLNVLTPGIGTKQYDLMNGDQRVFERRWQFYDGQHVIFTPKRMTAAELQNEVIKGYRRFYSIRSVLRYLMRLRFSNALEHIWGWIYIHRWEKDPTNRAYVQALEGRPAAPADPVGQLSTEVPAREAAR